MSVKQTTMHLLGSDLTAEKIASEIKRNLMLLQGDADDMGVEIDWSTVVIRVGEDYEEELSFVRPSRRHPYIKIEVQSERRA